MDPRIDDVLEFWFAGKDPARKWFTKDPAFDAEIRAKFSALRAEAAGGALDTWRSSARGSLALIVLLDQFSRNMFRDDPRAFETDGPALAITRDLLATGKLGELSLLQRSIALMPLQHSEDRDDQRKSLVEFGKLADEDAMYKNGLDYAKMHADIIERFGRFPHRNAILGRASTPEEQEFLTQPNSSF
jgi:uncharacterized protein (DUF924 family)